MFSKNSVNVRQPVHAPAECRGAEPLAAGRPVTRTGNLSRVVLLRPGSHVRIMHLHQFPGAVAQEPDVGFVEAFVGGGFAGIFSGCDGMVAGNGGVLAWADLNLHVRISESLDTVAGFDCFGPAFDVVRLGGKAFREQAAEIVRVIAEIFRQVVGLVGFIAVVFQLPDFVGNRCGCGERRRSKRQYGGEDSKCAHRFQAPVRTWMARLATRCLVAAPKAAMCGARAWAARSAGVAHFSRITIVSGPNLAGLVSASKAGPYSMQPVSECTAARLACTASSRAGRWPGLAVSKATTWIMGLAPVLMRRRGNWGSARLGLQAKPQGEGRSVA